MTSAQPLQPGEIRARGVGRRFRVRSAEARTLKDVVVRRKAPRSRELWALRGFDAEIGPGDALGVIGENGSGKSTLLKLLAGIFAPSEGTLAVGGRVGSLLELGAGFHPEFSGVENVYLNAAIHGLSRDYVDRHIDEIIDFAELQEFAHTPVKAYSSGMYMRLGFSVAMHVNPDVLLLDEVLAVGDLSFQQKCHRRIWEFKRNGGTIVFVSHDLPTVESLCNQAILLEHGLSVAEGTPGEVGRVYRSRVAGRADPFAEYGESAETPACRIADLVARTADGAATALFHEGQPIVLETRLYSKSGIRGAQLTVGIRDAHGRAIGSESLAPVDVLPRETADIRLHLPKPPLRDGRFVVDVQVLSETKDEVLAFSEGGLEFVVVGEVGSAGGPVRLDAEWEVVPEPGFVGANAGTRG